MSKRLAMDRNNTLRVGPFVITSNIHREHVRWLLAPEEHTYTTSFSPQLALFEKLLKNIIMLSFKFLYYIHLLGSFLQNPVRIASNFLRNITAYRMLNCIFWNCFRTVVVFCVPCVSFFGNQTMLMSKTHHKQYNTLHNKNHIL